MKFSLIFLIIIFSIIPISAIALHSSGAVSSSGCKMTTANFQPKSMVCAASILSHTTNAVIEAPSVVLDEPIFNEENKVAEVAIKLDDLLMMANQVSLNNLVPSHSSQPIILPNLLDNISEVINDIPVITIQDEEEKDSKKEETNIYTLIQLPNIEANIIAIIATEKIKNNDKFNEEFNEIFANNGRDNGSHHNANNGHKDNHHNNQHNQNGNPHQFSGCGSGSAIAICANLTPNINAVITEKDVSFHPQAGEVKNLEITEELSFDPGRSTIVLEVSGNKIIETQGKDVFINKNASNNATPPSVIIPGSIQGVNSAISAAGIQNATTAVGATVNTSTGTVTSTINAVTPINPLK